MTRTKLVALLSVALCTLAGTPGVGAAAANTTPAQAQVASLPTVSTNPDRESVARDYLATMTPVYDEDFGLDKHWAGGDPHPQKCKAGVPSAAVQDATLTTINYLRRLAGVGPATLATGAAQQAAQEAALMMHAARALNHYPDAGWPCRTDAGAAAAATSNLALGAAGAYAILLYADDRNVPDVGHRTWVLHPRVVEMASGSTSEYNALTVIGLRRDPAASANADLVAWPAAGYFPTDLAPSTHWSVHDYSGRFDLREATVTMTGPDGKLVPTKGTSTYDGVAWEPQGRIVSAEAGYDPAYTVRISGIRKDGAAVPDVEYTTRFIAPSQKIVWHTPPVVSGDVVPGSVVRVSSPGTMTPTRPLRSLNPTWLVNGEEVEWGERLRIEGEWAGKKLTLRLESHYDGYVGLTTVTVADRVPRGAAPELVGTLRVSGERKVGSQLSVQGYGRWSPDVPGFVRFSWLRNGTFIPGTRKLDPRYRVTAKDAGAKLSVRVEHVAEGYETRTLVVAAGRIASSGARGPVALTRPRVVCRAQVGRTCKVSAVRWRGAQPAQAWRWLRDGKPIIGATRPRYRLGRADVGHRVAVKVTGRRGAATTVVTSRPTAKVRR